MRASIHSCFRALKKWFLYVRGIVRFGPAQAYRGMEQIHAALDVFEEYYDRLPSKEEQVRLVRKLAWFEQTYKRIPRAEEMQHIVEQVEVR